MPAIGKGPISVTVTAKTGPDQAIASQVFPTVNAIKFDFARGVATLDIDSDINGPRGFDIQLSALVTITFNTTTHVGVLSTS